jgi:hypothetical protein
MDALLYQDLPSQFQILVLGAEANSILPYPIGYIPLEAEALFLPLYPVFRLRGNPSEEKTKVMDINLAPGGFYNQAPPDADLLSPSHTISSHTHPR